MKIAVVGSRDFEFELDMGTYLGVALGNINIEEVEFISGGARGVDSEIEKFCKEKNYPIKVIKPIDPSNKFDYLFRNVEIISLADKIIAFWDETSKGTKFVIDYSNARGKEVKIITKGLYTINPKDL